MDDQDKTPMAEPLDPKNLNLWCKPCDTYLVAGRFPMDVKAFSKATKAARCPDCEGKRRAANAKPAKTEEHQQEIRMAKADTVTPLRQPTREQKRQIIELLNEVYDTKAERYRGGETDLTVADTIGGGVMFGWVAQIREELFGPDGGNEEVEVLLAEIKEWQGKADQYMKTMDDALKQAAEAKTGFAECRTKLASLQGRMEALRKSFGPKVDRLASA